MPIAAEHITAKELKKKLLEKFKFAKLSVTTDGGWSTWLHIEWVDGPSYQELNKFVRQWDDNHVAPQDPYEDGLRLGQQSMTLKHIHSDGTWCDYCADAPVESLGLNEKCTGCKLPKRAQKPDGTFVCGNRRCDKFKM